MKAVMMYETGAPEVLKYEDVETPRPGAGEVLIKIAGIGINFAEVGRRSGVLPFPPSDKLPLFPGGEFSGTVEAVGEGVNDFQPGDRVFTRCRGCYAEYALAPASGLTRVPQGMELVAASTVPIMFETAWGCLVARGKLQAGETVLIQAAASGVGIALVQLAKHLGATVIGTASTDEKLAWAKSYGLDHGINYMTTDYVEEVKKLTSGKGVPMIVDGVGGEVFEKSFGALQPGGRIVVYGVASGRRTASVLLPNMWFQQQTLMGAGSSNCSADDMQTMLGLFVKGALKPVVDRVWPLREAAEAHRYIEARRVQGKVALTP
jgi:NADPH2:quinone reductase